MVDHTTLLQQPVHTLPPERFGVGRQVPLKISLISEHSIACTEINDESHNTQLFWAGRMRVWHYYVGATPTSLKSTLLAEMGVAPPW